MVTECEEYRYSLRWIFDEEKQHELNVKTLLKSEQALADFIYDIAKQLDVSLEIKAIPREEGSLKSEFIILWEKNKDKVFVAAITTIFSIALTTFFQQIQEPKSTSLDKEKFMIEIQEKVNSGSLTVEQAKIYIEEFSSIEKYKNTFFKANKADKEVSEIEVKQGGAVTATIPSEDFDNFISKKQSSEIIIPKAKVYIISPVLVAGTQEKWTGEYEGERIRFNIKDKEFLEKSQNKVISFNTGFFIICELQKVVKNIDGKEQVSWEVLEVTHSATDEENILEFEHSRKTKNKRIPGQMSLFD